MRWPFFLSLPFAVLMLSVSPALCAPAPLPAPHITLYTNGATVTEERLLAVENGELHFLLPAAVDKDSLRLEIKNAVASSTRFNQTAAPLEWASQTLRQQVSSAAQRVAELKARKEALAARMALWKEPRPKILSVKELELLDKRQDERLRALYQENEALNEPLKEAQLALKRANLRLEARGTATEALDVTVRVSAGKGGPLGSTVPVRLTYTLGNCGWKPMLRLDALTTDKAVEVTHLAAIEQQTGMDWTGAELTLSTSRPSNRLTPPTLIPWRIGPAPRPAPRSRALQATAMMAVPEAKSGLGAANDAMDSEAPPVFSEQAASSQWALGRRSIPSGEPVLLALDSQRWKADFLRLIRPSAQHTAYIVAKVTPPQPAVFRADSAQFLVDGVSCGTRPFDFSGSEDEISFGPDPSVTATMNADSAQSGASGLIGKRQTYEWRWTITVTNAHKFPVLVRVEDPEPQAMDKNIEVSINSEPQARKEKQALVWSLDVPAGDKATIRHQVSFSAPADLDANPGR